MGLSRRQGQSSLWRAFGVHHGEIKRTRLDRLFPRRYVNRHAKPASLVVHHHLVLNAPVQEGADFRFAYAIAVHFGQLSQFVQCLGPVAGQPSCLPTDVPAWNQACLIDGVLALGVKSGYGFEAIGNNSDTLGVNGGRFQGFGIAGVPVNFNQSGTRDFCAIEDGVVRANAPIAANTGGQGAAATLATAAEATCVAAPYAALQ